jgi:hypothetical protein
MAHFFPVAIQIDGRRFTGDYTNVTFIEVRKLLRGYGQG